VKQVPLQLITEPAPGTRAVIDRRSSATIVFSGHETNMTYVCGSCASPLIVGLDLQKFHGVVIKCNHCKSFNAVELLRRNG
jgi:DNA-directed RNA polymerase subunit RPC12/RpoP